MLEEIGHNKRVFISLMMVSSHNYYTYTHSINVCMYAIAIGSELGLSKNEMTLLAEGALLHDVGKSKIDSSIINKDGPLNSYEFEIIKKHPLYGEEILSASGEIKQEIIDIVSKHHEKTNGKGYPRGVGKEELSKLVQIVTIADIFDALTTKRSYKEALSSFEAFSLMLSKMRDELNIEILQKFISSLKA